MSQIRTIALMSGGLDSVLAAKIIADQGIEVIGVHMLTPFSPFTIENVENSPAAKSAKEIGIEFMAVVLAEDYLEIVKHPKHGYGRAANPCIDCHAYFIKKAAEVMRERKASFIITGEVVGQRPMSQQGQTLHMIDKEVGLKGIILRPLSAKVMP